MFLAGADRSHPNDEDHSSADQTNQPSQLLLGTGHALRLPQPEEQADHCPHRLPARAVRGPLQPAHPFCQLAHLHRMPASAASQREQGHFLVGQRNHEVHHRQYRLQNQGKNGQVRSSTLTGILELKESIRARKDKPLLPAHIHFVLLLQQRSIGRFREKSS